MTSKKAAEQAARYAMCITDISDKTQYTKEVVGWENLVTKANRSKGRHAKQGALLRGNIRTSKSQTEGPIPKKAAQLL